MFLIISESSNMSWWLLFAKVVNAISEVALSGPNLSTENASFNWTRRNGSQFFWFRRHFLCSKIFIEQNLRVILRHQLKVSCTFCLASTVIWFFNIDFLTFPEDMGMKWSCRSGSNLISFFSFDFGASRFSSIAICARWAGFTGLHSILLLCHQIKIFNIFFLI